MGRRQQRENDPWTNGLRPGFYRLHLLVWRYAREYQIKNNVRDDELTPKDYYYLLLGQYDQTSKLIDSSANRGLVIADTNSLVTKGYYDYYMEVEGPETSMRDTFDNLFVSILAKEKWDLILFVQPIGSYVNDGFRDMTMADDEIRNSFQITWITSATNISQIFLQPISGRTTWGITKKQSVSSIRFIKLIKGEAA